MTDLNKYVPESARWRRFENVNTILALHKAYEDAVKFYEEERPKDSGSRDRNRLYCLMLSKSRGRIKPEDAKDFLYVMENGLALV